MAILPSPEISAKLETKYPPHVLNHHLPYYVIGCSTMLTIKVKWSSLIHPMPKVQNNRPPNRHRLWKIICADRLSETQQITVIADEQRKQIT
jgi:hypothetical protein